jgi:hypothetical protein
VRYKIAECLFRKFGLDVVIFNKKLIFSPLLSGLQCIVSCQQINKFKQLNLVVGKGLMKCGGGGALGKKAK